MNIVKESHDNYNNHFEGNSQLIEYYYCYFLYII